MKLWIISGLLLIGAVSAGIFVSLRDNDSEERVQAQGQIVGYDDAASLVRDTQVIMVAEFVGENEQRVDLSSPVDGQVHAYRKDILRTFEVIDVLKGEKSGETEVVVRLTESVFFEGHGEQFVDLPPVKKGQTYVLFLAQSLDPKEPEMTVMAHPYQAELRSAGVLSFQASSLYKSSISERGLSPVPGSDAPFSLSVNQIRGLVRNPVPAPTPFTNTDPFAPRPTPVPAP